MISTRLKNIVLKQLKLADYGLTEETRAFEVPGWDSLNHVIILAAIEKDYGIRFDMREILTLKNLGGLQALIDSKMK